MDVCMQNIRAVLIIKTINILFIQAELQRWQLNKLISRAFSFAVRQILCVPVSTSHARGRLYFTADTQFTYYTTE